MREGTAAARGAAARAAATAVWPVAPLQLHRTGRRRTSPRGAAPRPGQVGRNASEVWLAHGIDGGGCRGPIAGLTVGTTPRGVGQRCKVAASSRGQAHDRWGRLPSPSRVRGANAKAHCSRGHRCNGATGCMIGLGCGEHRRARGKGVACAHCAQPSITGLHFRGHVGVFHECACKMALRAPTEGARALAMVECV